MTSSMRSLVCFFALFGFTVYAASTQSYLLGEGKTRYKVETSQGENKIQVYPMNPPGSLLPDEMKLNLYQGKGLIESVDLKAASGQSGNTFFEGIVTKPGQTYSGVALEFRFGKGKVQRLEWRKERDKLGK